MRSRYVTLTALAVTAFVAACDGSPTASRIPTSLVSLSPIGESANVDPTREIQVSFSASMMMGAERYAELHEGSYGGPVVAGTWRWAPPTVARVASRFQPTQSIERTTLLFTPDRPLTAGTRYTVHLGGNLQDARGRRIEYTSHGVRHLGGDWVTAGAMMDAGMAPGEGHMVPDWQHGNGSYGIAFPFTTAE